MAKNGTVQDAMCPSFQCEEGSLLLGVRGGNGRVSILTKPLKIDRSFIEIVKDAGIIPEQQFRFTNRCMQSDCKQWTSKGCGIAIRMSHFFKSGYLSEPLPQCSIRNACTWHRQEGDRICKLCPHIVTDITGQEVAKYFDRTFTNI